MFADTPLIMVETPEALEEMVKALSEAKTIGVDTESDSFHHYQEKVCLVQFSDLERDYILDPLSIGDISSLGPIFSNPEIVKILHGADYDIVCMGRDFDFKFHGLFDTMVAAQMLGLPGVGLADLIDRFFGHQIDKQYQRYDWAKRPLKNEHLEYARGDTHFLLALREILTRQLTKIGRLAHLEEECLLLQERQWVPKPFNPDGYLRIKGSHGLTDTSKRILRRLYLYRNEEARKMDRPAFKVMPDGILLTIARSQPKDANALDRLFSGKAPMKRKHGKSIVECVVEGLNDEFDIPEIKRPVKTGPTPKLTGRAAERGFMALKSWRNNLCAKEKNFSPVTVASNATLKAIVHHYPESLDELRKIPEVRNWQVEEFGGVMLKILKKAVPSNTDSDSTKEKRRRGRRTRKSAESEAP
jgi:ribonuclease D